MFNRLFSLIMMIPGIVQSIEVMHGNAKNGAEKKDLAMQALGLAGAVAQNALPEHKAEIDAAANLASNLIDNTVSFLNATKQMPTPAPAPSVK